MKRLVFIFPLITGSVSKKVLLLFTSSGWHDPYLFVSIFCHRSQHSFSCAAVNRIFFLPQHLVSCLFHYILPQFLFFGLHYCLSSFLTSFITLNIDSLQISQTEICSSRKESQVFENIPCQRSFCLGFYIRQPYLCLLSTNWLEIKLV